MKKEAPKKMSKAEAGRLGGLQTKKRHGLEHYREAGKKGFMVTVARHWQGDKVGYMRWLWARGWHADLMRILDAEPPPAPGEIRVVEIPVLPEEEDLDDSDDPLIGFYRLVDHVLASIRSAPLPADGGL
jgi:hypothetical protein